MNSASRLVRSTTTCRAASTYFTVTTLLKGTSTAMPPFTSILYLVLTSISLLVLAAPRNATAYDLPPVRQGNNLDDCAEQLNSQGGGWCEIRQSDETPSISSVWPQDLDGKTQMIVGPKAVLIAWNGAAFDPQNELLYFMGGGHADYGGNEVYEFNLSTGNWDRLTNPSPLSFLYRLRKATAKRSARYCWAPDMRRVPGAAHTYDGLQFSTTTRTIFLAMMGAANGACFNNEGGSLEGDPRVLFGKNRGAGIFEFNPSRKEARNGLAPLTWRRVADITLKYPRSLELPDGKLLFGNRTSLFRFDPVTGTVGGEMWQNADYGTGVAEFHPSGLVLSLHRNTLLARSLETKVARRIPTPGLHGRSLALNSDGTVFSWDGGHRILTIDPDSPESDWKLFDWARAGPKSGNRRVYSKWYYVPKYDIFVGLSTHKTGVWIYKHPPDMPDTKIAQKNPQRLIKQAKPGSTVTIPPGLYTRGLFIDKSLKLELRGAHFWGVAKRKGIINVKCNGCSVVIEDFVAEGREAGCLSGNCAGIKAEGVDFDLTVRRAHIDNTVMGILTDNRGGRLVVEDSTIENTGLKDRTRTLGHGLYAGAIDKLVVRRSTIRNTNGDGHILKSRAPETILDHVSLIGAQGYHSRSIDFPCGGTLQVTDSVIQHGENTDNTDLISVGTEAKSCKEIYPSDVSIEGSWIIIERDHSADERARDYGPSALFRWRAPMRSLVVANNHIVNLETWSTSETEFGDVTVPDLSKNNQMCSDRSACGLSEDNLPTP